MLNQKFLDQNLIAKIDESRDIFMLIDMSSMNPTDRASVTLDLQVLIWSEFLENRLPFLLTHSQMEELQKALTENKNIDELFDLIEDFSPNFIALWLEFSMEYKLTWVKKYWTNRYRELYEKTIKANEKALAMLEPELKKAQQAQIFAEKENWTELINLFRSC